MKIEKAEIEALTTSFCEQLQTEAKVSDSLCRSLRVSYGA